jgi:hypothetical protein
LLQVIKAIRYLPPIYAGNRYIGQIARWATAGVSDSEFPDWDLVFISEIDRTVFLLFRSIDALHDRRPARMAVGFRQAGD